MNKRKILIISGTRADYSLLKPLMDEVEEDKNLILQMIVTGSHMSKEFGYTYKEIEADGFKINQKISILTDKDNAEGIAKSMGLAMSGIQKSIEHLNPDLVVLLGDRYEMLAAGIAATICNVPIVHLYGGEVTEGSFDDAFRHSITKMSHLHFTSTELYRKRVIQLGENPNSVHNVGSLSIDNIMNLKFPTKHELENQINFDFSEKNLLVTFHPVTLENDSEAQFKNILDALGKLKKTHIIFTKANADPGGTRINKMIDNFVSRNKGISMAFESLGRVRYLSVMKYVDAVVGNSSSGIVEAPSFKVATINVGNRQKGRIRAESVLDCDATPDEISSAITKVYSPKFQEILRKVESPFGNGKAAVKIKKILTEINLNGLNKKLFYDLKL